VGSVSRCMWCAATIILLAVHVCSVYEGGGGETEEPCAYYYAPAPRRGGGGIRRSSASVVCLSDVAYIGSNSKTKRPRKMKLCPGVPQVTCDSHNDFKVKRSKVKVGRGHIVAAT